MNALVTLNFFILFLVLLLVIYLLVRLKRLEDKSVDVSARDIITFVEQMREMVVESERAAEILDSSIREREGVLEDLASLVESRLKEYERIACEEDMVERRLRQSNDEFSYQDTLLQKDYVDKLSAYEKSFQKKLDEQSSLVQQLKQDMNKERERFAQETASREAAFKQRLMQEKAIQDKLISEISAREEALNKILKAQAQRNQEPIRISIPKASDEPIVAAKAKIISQPVVKSTEEVLRTRTEPMLVKQSQDRIPVEQSNIIRSRTTEVSREGGVKEQVKRDTAQLQAEIQAVIHRLLLNGLNENQIAEKLRLPVSEVSKYLSLSS